jgi:hypothetical protein
MMTNINNAETGENSVYQEIAELCDIKRNGSFIQIMCPDRYGMQHRILIQPDELKKFLIDETPAKLQIIYNRLISETILTNNKLVTTQYNNFY